MQPEVGGGHGPGQNRAALAGHLARAARGRSWYSWAASLVLWLLATVLAVLFCDWVVPGFHADFPWGPLGFAVVLGVTGLLLQPLLVAGAVRLGWIGVLLLVFIGQALIVGVAAWLLPRVHVDGFWAAFLVSWIIGIVSTVVGLKTPVRTWVRTGIA